MATNEILKFCGTDTGTNLLSQSDYNTSAGTSNNRNVGNTAGEYLLSELVNKVLRQTSTVAAGVAKFLADNQGTNVTDALTADQIAVIMTNAIAARINPILTSYVQGPASATNNVLAVFDGTTGKLLKNSTMPISDVTKGAASSTDNAIARFDSTTGKILQNSSATIADSGIAYLRSSVSGTSWDNSVLVVEHSSGQQPQVGFHAPSNSAAGSIKFYGPTSLFELRNGNDSGFGTWHNKSISSLNGNVSGGNELDLGTNFDTRLAYEFVAEEWMSGKLFVSANLYIQRENGGGIIFEGVIVIYDLTAGGIADQGNISYGTHRGNDWGNGFYAPLNVSYSKDLDLVAGRSYQIQLRLKKDIAAGPYYPKGMSLNYQVS
jgi:hypothetical protein